MQIALKVKFDSLSAEARIIRKLENVKRHQAARARKKHGDSYEAGHQAERISLHEHRIMCVRPEARATHLAQGFLRGHPYSAMERVSNTAPNFTRARELVLRYGNGSVTELASRFDAWEEDARTYRGEKTIASEHIRLLRLEAQRTVAKPEPWWKPLWRWWSTGEMAQTTSR